MDNKLTGASKLLRLAEFAAILVGILFLTLQGVSSAQGGPGFGEAGSGTFNQCGRCHEEAYWDWRASAHNRQAFQGEQFQSVWGRKRNAPECLACHVTGYDPDTGAMTYAGVNCVACHYLIDENFDVEVRDHGEMSVPDLAEECAGCHGGDHARTFAEWEGSKHNGELTVGCSSCHDAHTSALLNDDLYVLCGDCHLQPVPTVSPHMFTDSGCTDCHPAPISTANVHMHGGQEAVADCGDCHMVTEADEWGYYPANTGHSMEVTLTACISCHGELHVVIPGAEPSEQSGSDF